MLPLATPAHLYHTVNGLTLLRYHVLANQPDVPTEVRDIVDRMVDEVLAVDPYFLGAPGFPLDLRLLDTGETLEAQALGRVARRAGPTGAAAETAAARDAFDEALGPYDSRLIGYDADAERVMAEAVRAVLAVDARRRSRTRMRWPRCSTRRATRTWGIPSSSGCSPS